MRFKGQWRDYQALALHEMEDHLTKGRLHVVAAPGAGKTVLGLEVVRRLGRRALVFAPTVAIRDQWAHRLTALFLDTPPARREVSDQLLDAGELTFVTYQALDGLRRSEGLDGLVRTLNASGPITLVLDEAHHLRREWWTGVEYLARSLEDVRLVALTATPPYDASHVEWARYEAVCGPIDLEVSIPELVRNGDLCPHQDHVILSEPTPDALARLDQRRRGVWRLQQELWADVELLDLLERHPWLVAPQDHVEAILEAPEMLSAVLILLAGAGRRLPQAPLKLLGVSARRVPRPSFAWLERFLDGVAGERRQDVDIGARRRASLRDQLYRLGLIEGGRVSLRESRSIFQLMASSIAKLDSIAEIVRAESAALSRDLRMVILSDHVRASDLPDRSDGAFRPSKLGVIPIFEHLRRQGAGAGRTGVLTGALVIVPRSALAAVGDLARAQGFDAGALVTGDLPACPDHVQITLGGVHGARLVRLVTALFAEGEIEILVGTQSLLGEGWDAPALNSLILASNTASFMLSNQMRGRAIRIDPDAPGKVANIWHLATVEPPFHGPLAELAETLNWGHLFDDGPPGLSDIAILDRRFRAFEGLSSRASNLIESGLGRVGYDPAADRLTANRRTLAAAADRPDTARRWSASLGTGGPRARVRQTAAANYAPRILAWSDTLQAATWSAASAAAFAAAEELQGLDSYESLGALGMAMAGAAILAGLPKLARAARLTWRNGSVEGCLEQVGRVVLGALAHAGLAREADVASGTFEVRESVDGRKDIVLRGVSRSVERQVIQAICEVLGPVGNPRYLLVRSSRLGWRMRTDYHPVPAAIGARRAWAEAFARLWSDQVGSSRLVYTRTPEGRRLLLQARAKSLAAGFQRSVDRRSAWL